MTTEHLVKLSVVLTPVLGPAAPHVVVSVPAYSVETQLTHSRQFEFEFVDSTGWIKVDLVHKSDQDQHQAVIIDNIKFFGISDPRFVWLGQYTPDYPKIWFSQQHPTPARQLTNTDYLGWNGTWKLDFAVPVFTWIHQVQNLGWIHP